MIIVTSINELKDIENKYKDLGSTLSIKFGK